MIEASPLAILVADDDGRYVDANPTACRLFGHAREGLLGRRVYDFVDPGEVPPTRALWSEFRAQGAQAGEFAVRRPDGGRRLLRYTAIADFAPGLHVSFLEDITEARATERARTSAEQDRDRIFALSLDLLCIVDGQRRLRRVNPAWRRVLGYDEGELLGRDYIELVHPDDVATLLDARELVVERGSVTGHQSRWRHRHGHYRWLDWSSSAYDGEHYAVGRDVTEQRELAAQRDYERALFETVLRQMPSAVAVVQAPTGKVLLTNERFGQVLRHPAVAVETVADYAAYRGFHPDGRPYAAEDWPVARAVLHGEVVQEHETDYLFGDGTRGVIATNAAPIRNAEGEVVAAVCIFRDVTEQKQARRALELSEARFRTLADSLPLVIWTGDAQGRTQYFNRHWYEYTGRQPPGPGEIDSRDGMDVVHPEDQVRLAELAQDRRARGLALELAYRLRRHDGVYRWHLGRSVPVADETGKVVRRVGSITDIEDQRRAIEELQLERDLRERFVAALSHDLRSPLQAVKTSAQLILRRPEAEMTLTQGARILRNVTHADQLIQNLLDASRISAGEGMPVSLAECDVTALVRDVVDDQITTHGDRFRLEAPPRVLTWGDRAALRRVLENLLGNAVKYGDPHALIRVAVIDDGGGQVRLAVHNEGHPIPAEEQGKIFEPYHRARGRSDGDARAVGWGLGLTVVRGIAEAHGGTVQVDSGPDRGTTFTVTLGKS